MTTETSEGPPDAWQQVVKKGRQALKLPHRLGVSNAHGQHGPQDPFTTAEGRSSSHQRQTPHTALLQSPGLRGTTPHTAQTGSDVHTGLPITERRAAGQTPLPPTLASTSASAHVAASTETRSAAAGAPLPHVWKGAPSLHRLNDTNTTPVSATSWGARPSRHPAASSKDPQLTTRNASAQQRSQPSLQRHQQQTPLFDSDLAHRVSRPAVARLTSDKATPHPQSDARARAALLETQRRAGTTNITTTTTTTAAATPTPATRKQPVTLGDLLVFKTSASKTAIRSRPVAAKATTLAGIALSKKAWGTASAATTHGHVQPWQPPVVDEFGGTLRLKGQKASGKKHVSRVKRMILKQRSERAVGIAHAAFATASAAHDSLQASWVMLHEQSEQHSLLGSCALMASHPQLSLLPRGGQRTVLRCACESACVAATEGHRVLVTARTLYLDTLAQRAVRHREELPSDETIALLAPLPPLLPASVRASRAAHDAGPNSQQQQQQQADKPDACSPAPDADTEAEMDVAPDSSPEPVAGKGSDALSRTHAIVEAACCPESRISDSSSASGVKGEPLPMDAVAAAAAQSSREQRRPPAAAAAAASTPARASQASEPCKATTGAVTAAGPRGVASGAAGAGCPSASAASVADTPQPLRTPCLPVDAVTEAGEEEDTDDSDDDESMGPGALQGWTNVLSSWQQSMAAAASSSSSGGCNSKAHLIPNIWKAALRRPIPQAPTTPAGPSAPPLPACAATPAVTAPAPATPLTGRTSPLPTAASGAAVTPSSSVHRPAGGGGGSGGSSSDGSSSSSSSSSSSGSDSDGGGGPGAAGNNVLARWMHTANLRTPLFKRAGPAASAAAAMGAPNQQPPDASHQPVATPADPPLGASIKAAAAAVAAAAAPHRAGAQQGGSATAQNSDLSASASASQTLPFHVASAQPIALPVPSAPAPTGIRILRRALDATLAPRATAGLRTDASSKAAANPSMVHTRGIAITNSTSSMVSKALHLKKAKMVVLAPNIEQVECEGGLDDSVAAILARASELNIPVVFSLSRKKLGKLYSGSRQVSAVALLELNAVSEQTQRMVVLAAQGTLLGLGAESSRSANTVSR
ncbi:MAG: hypothetical protein WDW38_001448 [Sanguina aurantia]